MNENYAPSGLVSAGTISLQDQSGGTSAYTSSGLVSAGTMILIDPLAVKFWHRRNGEKRPLVLKRGPNTTPNTPDPEEDIAAWRRTLVAGEFFPNERTTGIYWAENDPRYEIISSGWPTYNTPNTLVENKIFRGVRPSVNAANVHFRNCLFEGMTSATAVYPLLSAGNPGITNLMIEDCTFRPSGPDAAGRGINGIVGWNFTLIRCNIYHVNDGVGVAPPSGQQTANVHLEGTWIHDAIMTNIPAGDTKRWDGMLHPDCIDWDGGQGLTATGCRFNARPNGNIGVAQTPPIWEYDNEGNIKKYNGNDVVLTGNSYYNESQRLWGSSILMCANMQQYVGIPEFRKCWFEGGGGAGLNLSAAAGTSFTVNGVPNVPAVPSCVVEDCWFANLSADWRAGANAGVIRRSSNQTVNLVRCYAYNRTLDWDDTTGADWYVPNSPFRQTPYTAVANG